MIRSSQRCLVRFFPQSKFVHRAKVAPEVAQQEGRDLSFSEVEALRKRSDYNLWQALARRDWDTFDSIIKQLGSCAVPLDEVTYTMLAHGYLLSHRHPSSASLVVLEEMKSADMHPAIVRLQERLTHSHLQFADLGLKCSSHAWQNLTRLSFMSAGRLRRTRMKRVQQKLQLMSMDELYSLDRPDVKQMIANEHKEALERIGDEYDELEALEASDTEEQLLLSSFEEEGGYLEGIEEVDDIANDCS